MHDSCVAGYVCDTTRGQCVTASAGSGDTLANCEADCSINPPTEDTYECDVETFTCVVSTSGDSSSTCSSACADETPSALIGLWRGMNVQEGFVPGEWVMNFTETSAAWGVLGSPRQTVADVAIIAPSTLRLTVTSPASSVGTVLIATYTNPGWPTGPETTGLSIGTFFLKVSV